MDGVRILATLGGTNHGAPAAAGEPAARWFVLAADGSLARGDVAVPGQAVLRLDPAMAGRDLVRELALDVWAVDYISLEVECLKGGTLSLVWCGGKAGEGDWPRRYPVRLAAGRGAQEILIPTAEIGGWSGPLRLFGFRAEEVASAVTIHRVRFLAAGHLARLRLQRARGGEAEERLMIQGESRPVLPAPAGTVWEIVTDVPPGARLRAGFGFHPGAQNLPGSGVAFSVEAAPAEGGKARVLLARQGDPRLGPEARSWQDATLDLAGLDGRTVRFRFLTAPSGAGGGDEPPTGMAGRGNEEREPTDRVGDYALWSRPFFFLPAGDRDARRCNVVLYVVDTVRADRLSLYGAPRRTTPHLDRLAREGYIFVEPRAQASWTGASVGSILTSLYPSRHGAEQERERLLPECLTLAEALGVAGWLTQAFVANGHLKPPTGFDQGFDSYVYLRGKGDPPVADSSQVVGRLLPWLEEAAAEPFFLYVHVVDPHGPYDPRPPYDTLFDPDYRGSFDGRYGPPDFRELPPAAVDPRDLEHLRALHDGEVAQSDFFLGLLLAALRHAGLGERTLLLFTADHGEEFLDHGGWDHARTLYGEQLNVPLVVRAPTSGTAAPPPAGGVVREPVLLVDLFPTVLDFLGLAPPVGSPPPAGRSFLPLLAHSGDGRVFAGRPLFSEEKKDGHDLLAVEQEGFKMIRRWTPEQRDELYDLAADPGERRDLIELRPEIGRRLAALGEEIRHQRSALRQAQPLDEETREELRALGYLR